MAEEIPCEPSLIDHNPNKDAVAPQPPTESISCLAWAGTRNLLAAGSWDSSVRVWDVHEGLYSQPLASHVATVERGAPVLSCAFNREGTHLVTGGCDQRVRVRDLQAQQDWDLGEHTAPVRHVAVVPELDLVVSSGWDAAIHFWSTRQRTPVASIRLEERPYAMDVKFPQLVVGCADQLAVGYNLQALQLSEPFYKTKLEALKWQIRSLSVFPDGDGFVVGSLEGRGAIQHFTQASKDFSFKCHRTKQAAFAVNAVDFHPRFGTLATAGSDGEVSFWDKKQKRRIKRMASCYYPLTAARFSAEGKFLAYAVSYDWSQGAESHLPGLPCEVLIHRCEADELRAA